MLPCNVMCGCYLLSQHTVVWWDNLVCCVFVCTVTDFSAVKKDSGVKLHTLVRLLSGMIFSHFSELLPRHGSPEA